MEVKGNDVTSRASVRLQREHEILMYWHIQRD
jgi:hypothetical protein